MTALQEELEKIRADHGYLDDELLVKVASDPGHVLHNRFEWDDGTAGHAYRLTQAQRMFRCVKTPYVGPGGPASVRAYLAVPRDDETKKMVYQPTEEVLEDPHLRKVVLAQMNRELKAMENRYGRYVEFANLLRDALKRVET